MPSHELYETINAGWPANMPVPTDEEAIAGSRRLYKEFAGEAWRGKVRITSGNRYTWIRRGEMVVNPNRVERFHAAGWPSIVHDLSHVVHWILNPELKPHHENQAVLEDDMRRYVIDQKFHEGTLIRKAKPTKRRDIVAERYGRIVERQRRWEAKLKRAQTALGKAERDRRQYERRHGDRVTGGHVK